MACFPVLAEAQARRVPEVLRPASVPRTLSLGPLSDAERRPGARPAMEVGVRRLVPAAMGQPATSFSGGRAVLTVSLASPGATRLRVHFRKFDAGAGEVWVYSADQREAAGPYSGKGIFGTGEFWSGGVDGDTVVVGYAAAPGSSPAALPFTIDAIAHQWSDAPNTAAAGCNLDVTCYPQYQALASAVVHFYFDGDDGKYYACSGSMIDTRSGSHKPYLMTAHHCISSAAEAQSIEAHFFYQTATCSGTPPALSSVPSVVGGSYLAGGDFVNGDYSLVLLSQNVPDGVGFLKWNTTVDSNASLTGIHHPAGSYKRISFGTRTADRTISIEGQIGPTTNYYQVTWQQGVTENGSSGSPLLDSDGALVGTLTAGPFVPTGLTACDITPRSATYGRFSAAYNDVSQYLEDQASPFTATPASLNFQMMDGTAAQDRQAVTIATTSSTPLTMTATSNRPWLRVSGAGVVSASAPATLTISIDPAALTSPGGYNGLITVTAGSGGALTIPVAAGVSFTRSVVSMTVSPNPVYQSADNLWHFSLNIGESAGVFFRVTSFKVDGREYSNLLPTTMGGLQNRSIQIQASGINPPETSTLVLSGSDIGTGRTWEVSQNVTFLDRWVGPVLKLTSAPNPIYQNPDPSAACQWTQSLVLQETAGYPAQLTGFKIGASDLSGELARDFGTVRLPANGSLLARLCWKTQPVLPTVQAIEVDGTDDSGVAVSATALADIAGTPANAATLAVTPGQVQLTPAAASSQVAVDLAGAQTAWSATVVSAYDTGWLTIGPASGTGGGSITVTANPAGLRDGYYSATILIQAANAFPQSAVATVSLRVGAAGQKPAINAGGIVNAWWPRGGMAPGSLISIWGTNLATGLEVTPSVPFANRLAGTTVTINGILAPLFYVSPYQLNVQVPFEIAPGTAQVAVTVNGQSDTATMQVVATGPGICSDGAGKLCYEPAGKRGDYKLLFVTGQGTISPKVPTGAAPFASTPLGQLPQLRLDTVRVTVGGIPAPVFFAGIPSWSVGVLQINFQVPVDAPLGDQPINVSIVGQPSQTATITVQ